MAAKPDDVLGFWFEDCTPEQWFAKNDAFDAALKMRFGACCNAAATGALDGWAADGRGALALVLVLDQFPRNLYRDDPRAWATDGAALMVAEAAIMQGWDAALAPLERMFLYLPFQHAEDRVLQARSVALYTALDEEPGAHPKALESARRHREIVERFGRFPHRNAVLGRTSTPDELAFLEEPDSSF